MLPYLLWLLATCESRMTVFSDFRKNSKNAITFQCPRDDLVVGVTEDRCQGEVESAEECWTLADQKKIPGGTGSVFYPPTSYRAQIGIGCVLITSGTYSVWNDKGNNERGCSDDPRASCICYEYKPYLTAGFSMQFDTRTGDSSCVQTKTTPFALNLAYSATDPYVGCGQDDDSRRFSWAMCEPDKDASQQRNQYLYTSSGRVVASCEKPQQKIIFGFTIQFTTDATGGEDCLKRNTKACDYGSSTCFTEDCPTDGNDRHYVYLVCDYAGSSGASLETRVVRSTTHDVSAQCDTGLSVAFGFALTWSTELNCANQGIETCDSGPTSCAPKDFGSKDNCGYNDAVVVVACQSPVCSRYYGPGLKPDDPLVGVRTCMDPPADTDWKPGTVCEFSCGEGFHLKGNNEQLCRAGVWTWQSENATLLGANESVLAAANETGFGAPPECVDIDECQTYGVCSPHATCNNTVGGYNCGKCKDGFEGDGLGVNGCLNIDECQDPNKCPVGTTCKDTFGSYFCSPSFSHLSLVQLANGQSGTGEVTPLTLSTTTGGDRLSLGLEFSTSVETVMLRYGFVGQSPATMFVCQDNDSTFTVISTGQQTFECRTSPGVGTDLSFEVQTCVGSVCHTEHFPKGTGSFSYPALSITDNTLEIRASDNIDDPSVPLQSKKFVAMFSGTGFLASLRVKVFFGPKRAPLRFPCRLNDKETNEFKIVCVGEGNGVDNMTFAVLTHYSKDEQERVTYNHWVNGTDEFAFKSQIQPTPIVERVKGCVTMNTDPGTVDCPTDGRGTLIHVYGNYFTNVSTVAIGGSACADRTFINRTCITCVLPPGTGANKLVVVTDKTLQSEPKLLLSYANPTISEIQYSESTISEIQYQSEGAKEFTSALNLPRVGGGTLQVLGSNFGKEDAKVLIGSTGSIPCQHSQHDRHSILMCELPKGTGRSESVRVLQSNGGLSPTKVIAYTQCDEGHYWKPSLLPDVECAECPKGSYSEVTGADECQVCRPGRYTNETAQAICTPCESGWFNKQNNLTACEKCTKGTYAPSRGMTKCRDCLQGQFQNLTGQDSCRDCPKGRYGDEVARVACKDCDVNRFADDEGQLQCDECQPGRSVDRKGAAVCIDCKAGYFRGRLEKTCQKCPPGKKNFNPRQPDCTDCQPGNYMDEAGGTQCKQCPKGTAQDAWQGKGCVNCTLGTYAKLKGQRSCSPCDLGRYSNVTGMSTCTACEKGRYQDSLQQSDCLKCPTGTFAGMDNQKQCAICDAGTFSDVKGAHECKSCEKGRSQDSSEQDRCESCPAGTFAALEEQKKCSPCDPGEFSKEGAHNCTMCEAGSYSNEDGTGCIPCSNGTFALVAGFSECKKCSPGKFSGYNAVDCMECSPGTFQPSVGSLFCKTCPRGRYSGKGLSGCDVCDDDSVAGEGAGECVKCPGNAVPDIDNYRCICDVGKYGDHNGQCIDCEEGWDCRQKGITVEIMYPLPGYWTSFENPDFYTVTTDLSNNTNKTVGVKTRSTPQELTATLYRCIHIADCPGGPGGSKSCVEPRTGPLCARCMPGFQIDGFSGTCEVCSSREASIGITVTLFLLVLCAFTLMCWLILRADRNQEGGMQKSQASFTVRNVIADVSRFAQEGMDTDHQDKVRDPMQMIANLGRSAKDLTSARSPRAGSSMKRAASMRGSLHSRSSFGIDEGSPRFSSKRSPSKGSKGSGKNIRTFNLDDVDDEMTENPAHTNSKMSGKRGTMNLQRQNTRQQVALERQESISSIDESGVSSVDFDGVSTESVHHADTSINLTYPLKIVVTFFQIATNLTTIATIPFPDLFKGFMQVFSFLNVDFIPWQTVGCSVEGYNYYMKLVLITLIPIGVFLCLVLFFYLPTFVCDRFDMSDEDDKRKQRAKHRAQFVKLVCFTVFLMYPVVSSNIFSVFECLEVDGQYYLMSDFNVECYNDQWYNYVGYASAMMVLYPLGVPIALTCILFRNRKVLYEDKNVATALGFLYEAYRVDMWYFEIMDMVQKLFLTSLLRFFPPDYQLPVGMMAVCVYSVSVLFVCPYVRKSYDMLMLAVQTELLMLMQICYIIQKGYDPSEGLPHDVSIVLSIIMIIFMVVILIVAIIQMFMFARKLHRNYQLKQRTKDSGIKFERQSINESTFRQSKMFNLDADSGMSSPPAIAEGARGSTRQSMRPSASS